MKGKIMMEKLLNILNEIKPDVDFTKEAALITDNILDSISIMELVNTLEDAYDIDISPLDIVPQNFQSADAILALVTRLMDE